MRPQLTLGIVFRLGKHDINDRFYPNGLAADTQDFELSTQEKQEAAQTGVGALSVWLPSTTAVQANAFRPPGTHTVLDLDVQKIMAFPLQVLRESEKRRLPGYRGHCVIENVWGDKNARKAIRAYLVTLIDPQTIRVVRREDTTYPATEEPST